MGILTAADLRKMGFASVGENARISDRASFYNCGHIQIGNNTRIDDFCVLSAGAGGITIGSYIHIAVFSSLIGGGAIRLEDFCNISSRVAIYSSNDDYSGEWMTNPTVPAEFTGVVHADVVVGKHVIVGAGSVILPGVTLEEGAVLGALSLAKTNCAAFGVYAGSPAKKIAERRKNLLQLEKAFLSRLSAPHSNA